MKDCVRFAPMLGAREGELSRDDAAALAAHLEGCAECRAREAELLAMEGLVAESLLARANTRDFAPFVDQVMARVGETTPATRDQAELKPAEARAGVARGRPQPGRAEPVEAGAARGRPQPARAEPVEARVRPSGGGWRRGFLAWLAFHRRAAFAALVPVVAAAAILMYVRSDGGPRQIAELEVTAEGEATMLLETSDGPVVLLAQERS